MYKVGARISHLPKRLRDKLRSAAFGAYRQYRNVFRQLVRELSRNARHNGFHHVVLAARLEQFKVGNIQRGQGMSPFESESVELVAIPDVENEKLFLTLQSIQ
ncbi:MAG TPA: hypothetical protein VF135_11690 [Terriglobales bacterium]